MITHVIAIRCDRCAFLATYDEQDDALDVLRKARRYGWTEGAHGGSLCPRCTEEQPAERRWHPCLGGRS